MMYKILLLGNAEVGLYAFRRELIEALVAQNYDVVAGFPFAETPERIRALGCEIVDTKINRHGTNPIEDGKLFIRYMSIFRKYRPTIVLTLTIKPNIYGSFACQLCGIPYINNITGLGAVFQKDTLLTHFAAALQSWAYRKSSCVAFENRANMERFLRMGVIRQNIRARLMPGSGVNLVRHPYEPFPLDNGIIRFITVARIQCAKGFNELFEAARRIREQYPRTEFHIVGRFEEDEFKEKMGRLARDGVIVYHGEMMQEDVHRLIARCHCLVHPSYHEGLSNVCLEAAAAGRPVIATDIPGCRETFDEGRSGYGCKVKDEESLYTALERFIHTPIGEQEAMGCHGRAKMEREFDRRIVVNAYLEEIERVLS